MRNFRLLLLFVVLPASCTRTAEILTHEEVQRSYINDALNPAGTYFWDEFGQYYDCYDLDDKESEMLGEWRNFPADGCYLFFPNKLFIYSDFENKYKDDPARAVEQILGIWFIKDNTVYARIFGFDEVGGRTRYIDDSKAKHEYVMVEPYDVKIVDIREIQSTGYTRNYFNPIEMPEPLKERLVIPRQSRKDAREGLKDGVGMIRILYEIYPITNHGMQKIYNLFSLVPRFAKDNVSGLDIVTNPALVQKYFVESLTFPYKDYSYPILWDIGGP